MYFSISVPVLQTKWISPRRGWGVCVTADPTTGEFHKNFSDPKVTHALNFFFYCFLFEHASMICSRYKTPRNKQ